MRENTLTNINQLLNTAMSALAEIHHLRADGLTMLEAHQLIEANIRTQRRLENQIRHALIMRDGIVLA